MPLRLQRGAVATAKETVTEGFVAVIEIVARRGRCGRLVGTGNSPAYRTNIELLPISPSLSQDKAQLDDPVDLENELLVR